MGFLRLWALDQTRAAGAMCARQTTRFHDSTVAQMHKHIGHR